MSQILFIKILIKCYIDVIGEFIENELVEQYNLIRKIIPVELKEDDNIANAKSRIYIRYIQNKK